MDIETMKKSIEICKTNNKELVPFMFNFLDTLTTFMSKFNEYNLDPDYDNFCSRLETLKVEESDDFVKYDEKTNKLYINSKKLNEIEDEEKIRNIFSRPILNMFTYVYNIEADSFNRGITFTMDDTKHADFINEKMDDRVIELFFGNDDEFYEEDGEMKELITLPSAKEQIASDMQLLIGSDNLYSYYLNGRGDLFFDKMSNLFYNKEDCLSFIDQANDLKESNIQKDNDYNSSVDILVDRAKNLTEQKTL